MASATTITLAVALFGLAVPAAHGDLQALRADEAPVVDGLLTDPVWATAPACTTFTHREPVEGGPPSQRTEVRVLFDDRYLYFAIRCYDSEPDRILAKRMRRDDRLFEDDSIEIVLDTYNNRRGGYCFSTNSLGAQRDALLIDEGRANAEATWKPSERLSLEAEYEINRVELPTGHFTTHRTSQLCTTTFGTRSAARTSSIARCSSSCPTSGEPDAS